MAARRIVDFERRVGRVLALIGVERGAHILVALSGGPDSVALVRAMLALRERLGIRVSAAHLNHGIRGAESDRDEAFVRKLAAKHDVALHVGRADGLRASMPNLEERAREARLDFLTRVATDVGASHIALGHHADDQAETVMLRLLRGASIAGLGGMAERGPGMLIRPLLSVSRADIVAYLDALGSAYVSDSSNESPAIARNRIRNELLPMLEREYAPGISARLADLARDMRATNYLTAELAMRELEKNMRPDGSLAIEAFGALHPVLRAEVMRRFLERRLASLRRIERSHVEAACELAMRGPVSGSIDLPGKARLSREYNSLRVGPIAEQSRAISRVRLNTEGSTLVEQAGWEFHCKTVPARNVPKLGDNKMSALFDGPSISDGLFVRSWLAGDRILPIGMSGHRKVTDVFIDAKVPRSRRATYPLVELNGAIAWIPGVVRGNEGLVTEATSNVAVVVARHV
ncbi:MAG TPA: tRNA lysidine(34) synthetase TilS [Candidatus Binataceae bacterium]|nr:tRNA lysidine(34) synthetase TilS [Candidatus Binataceae bacterium]